MTGEFTPDDSDRLVDDIMDVWGDYDDFDTLGYVGFVIENEAREIRYSDWDNAESELADVAICSLRMLSENTDDPYGIVRDRLTDRMEGNQEEIIQRYKEQYENE